MLCCCRESGRNLTDENKLQKNRLVFQILSIKSRLKFLEKIHEQKIVMFGNALNNNRGVFQLCHTEVD